MLAAVVGAAGARAAQSHYLSLTLLPDAPQSLPPAGGAPALAAATEPFDGTVSVVIPARDEAANLPALFAALGPLEHSGPIREIIVVDDASSDGTGRIARDCGASVVRLEEKDRPADWLGKPNACQRGADACGGEWLLFLDADTRPTPAVVHLALAYATSRRLDAVSLLLEQRCETLWERLLVPFAYQQFFAGVDTARLRRPDTGEAMLNGQFILIRRAAYRSVGGHGAVRGSIVEDVALAGVLKAAGCQQETLRGERHAAVRMYQGLRTIRQGFGKNAYAFLAIDPQRGVKVALSSMGAAAVAPLLGLAAGATGALRIGLIAVGVAAWAAQAALLLPWLKRSRVPSWYAALQPLSAVVFNAIAIESTVRSVLRLGLSWKGRTYR